MVTKRVENGDLWSSEVALDDDVNAVRRVVSGTLFLGVTAVESNKGL